MTPVRSMLLPAALKAEIEGQVDAFYALTAAEINIVENAAAKSSAPRKFR